ncbi:MAG: AAA family ATPase [Bacteroidota bacterium]
MKIKSIELINLKSHERSKLELSKNINLLVGVNNSGKSVIIKSLLNLQYQRVFHKDDIRSAKKYTKIYTEVIEINRKENESFRNRSHPEEFEKSNEFTLCWGMPINDQPEQFYFYNSNLNATRAEYDKVNVEDSKGGLLDLKNFPRFSENENENNFIYPFLAKRKTENYDSQIRQDETFKVSDSFRSLAAKINKIGNPSHQMNARFTDLCMDILGFKIGTISSLNGMEPGIYADISTTIPLRSMGDGVANILGFIVILLTEDRKLFLIEELENDVHPKALKKLLNLIIEKSGTNQFVISTHSHIVLKHLGASLNNKIFYIDWSPKELNSDSRESIPTSFVTEIENKPQAKIDILEKLGYELHDFELYESYLILEESSAERIIRDFLIPNIIPELYNKIKTIAAKGVGDLKPRVNDFNRLFVFIHTNPMYLNKAWVIADGDESGRTSILELKAIHKSWPEKHFINFAKNNFEEYYPSRFQEDVQRILALKHKEKPAAKKELLNNVMEWALANRELAIEEFSKSANEVINLLNGILLELKNK